MSNLDNGIKITSGLDIIPTSYDCEEKTKNKDSVLVIDDQGTKLFTVSEEQCAAIAFRATHLKLGIYFNYPRLTPLKKNVSCTQKHAEKVCKFLFTDISDSVVKKFFSTSDGKNFLKISYEHMQEIRLTELQKVRSRLIDDELEQLPIASKDCKSENKRNRLDIERKAIPLTTYNGEFIYELKDVESIVGKVKSGELHNLLVHTPIYTSDVKGYKLCMGLNFGGNKKDYNTKRESFGACFAMLPNLYDEELQWPFRPKISVFIQDVQGQWHGSSTNFSKYTSHKINRQIEGDGNLTWHSVQKVFKTSLLADANYCKAEDDGTKTVDVYVKVDVNPTP